jgi:ferric-dicitrate binding protein FerR (iron transport regulator)
MRVFCPVLNTEMANNDSYQPDPQDLELARLLDRDFMDDKPSADTDPLMPFLKEYKVRSRLKIRAESGPGLFRDIQNEIDSEHKKSGVFRLHPAFWRVAAVLLVAAILSLIYLFTDLRQPELLAESGSSAIQTTLIDGSQVTLRPYSAIYTLSESQEEQRYEIRGEVYFEVEQLPGRDFIVMTEFAMARITGTAFTISSWGERSRIFLESGSLHFSMPDGSQQVELFPGQFSQTFNERLACPVM